MKQKKFETQQRKWNKWRENLNSTSVNWAKH